MFEVHEYTVGGYQAAAGHLPGVLLSGDAVRVDCDEAGAFYMLDAETLRACIAGSPPEALRACLEN